MTRIRLKPNSAEFADENEKIPVTRHCDMPGCSHEGEHRAPRNRDNIGMGNPSDYYWFCLPHVQDFNKAWDYFSGMSADEVESHIVRSMYWDRPTRRFDGMAMQEELKRKAWQTYHFTDKEPPREQPQQKRKSTFAETNTPEFQAMAIMGLEPPLSRETIKARYKELVKLHHPDVNGGTPESVELLKRINMAYTILKLAQEKFEKLPEFQE